MVGIEVNVSPRTSTRVWVDYLLLKIMIINQFVYSLCMFVFIYMHTHTHCSSWHEHELPAQFELSPRDLVQPLSFIFALLNSIICLEKIKFISIINLSLSLHHSISLVSWIKHASFLFLLIHCKERSRGRSSKTFLTINCNQLKTDECQEIRAAFSQFSLVSIQIFEHIWPGNILVWKQ